MTKGKVACDKWHIYTRREFVDFVAERIGNTKRCFHFVDTIMPAEIFSSQSIIEAITKSERKYFWFVTCPYTTNLRKLEKFYKAIKKAIQLSPIEQLSQVDVSATEVSLMLGVAHVLIDNNAVIFSDLCSPDNYRVITVNDPNKIERIKRLDEVYNTWSLPYQPIHSIQPLTELYTEKTPSFSSFLSLEQIMVKADRLYKRFDRWEKKFEGNASSSRKVRVEVSGADYGLEHGPREF